MKRIILLLTALLVLAGCTGTGKKDNSGPTTAPTSITATTHAPSPSVKVKDPCTPPKFGVASAEVFVDYYAGGNNGQGQYIAKRSRIDKNGVSSNDTRAGSPIVLNDAASVSGKGGKLVWSYTDQITPLGGYAVVKPGKGPNQEVMITPGDHEVSATPDGVILHVHLCGVMSKSA